MDQFGGEGGKYDVERRISASTRVLTAFLSSITATIAAASVRVATKPLNSLGRNALVVVGLALGCWVGVVAAKQVREDAAPLKAIHLFEGIFLGLVLLGATGNKWSSFMDSAMGSYGVLVGVFLHLFAGGLYAAFKICPDREVQQ